MPLHGEPKNGDFAKYVESLGRGGPPPGQVLPDASERPGKRLGLPSWGRARGKGVDLPTPTSPPASPLPTPMPPGAQRDSQQPAPTLAARAGKRRLAFGLTVASVLLFWQAAGMLMSASTLPFAIENYIPALFLGGVALMLLKAARDARSKAAGQPLPRYGRLDSLKPRPPATGELPGNDTGNG